MGLLTEEQQKNGYFSTIGGFRQGKIIHTVEEYDGSESCCIACTQLEGRYSEAECRKNLRDWISFLKTHTTAFRALHFNCNVPQALFDAACCQENLVELRLKWGSYSDLSDLAKPKHLQYLYLGSCSGVEDLSPITQCSDLRVLFLENTKRITDYSMLQKLKQLEQIVITGTLYSCVSVDDLDFVLHMPALSSLWLPNVRLLKSYSDTERETLRARNIQGIHDQPWWMV